MLHAFLLPDSCWPAPRHCGTLGACPAAPLNWNLCTLMGNTVTQELRPWRHRVFGAQTSKFGTVVLLTPAHPRSASCLPGPPGGRVLTATKAQRPWRAPGDTCQGTYCTGCPQGMQGCPQGIVPVPASSFRWVLPCRWCCGRGVCLQSSVPAPVVCL